MQNYIDLRRIETFFLRIKRFDLTTTRWIAKLDEFNLPPEMPDRINGWIWPQQLHHPAIIGSRSYNTAHYTCICTRKSGNPSWCEALADAVDRLYKNGRLKSRYACAVYFHMLASVYMYTYIYIYGARIGSRLRAGEDATARRFHERRLFSLFLGLWWVHPSNWNDVKFPTWNVM